MWWPMATNEYWRKAFHLLGLCIPLTYMWLPENIFMAPFFSIASTFIIIDLARLKIRPLERIFLHVAKKLLRVKEYSQPTGTFYFFIGSALTIILFPKQIAIGALFVLVLSDAAAALVGQRFGRYKIWGKTIEGSMAFFLSAWLILALYFGREPLRHLIPALAGTLTELFPFPVDDNLSIPLVIGLSYALLF